MQTKNIWRTSRSTLSLLDQMWDRPPWWEMATQKPFSLSLLTFVIEIKDHPNASFTPIFLSEIPHLFRKPVISFFSSIFESIISSFLLEGIPNWRGIDASVSSWLSRILQLGNLLWRFPSGNVERENGDCTSEQERATHSWRWDCARLLSRLHCEMWWQDSREQDSSVGRSEPEDWGQHCLSYWRRKLLAVGNWIDPECSFEESQGTQEPGAPHRDVQWWCARTGREWSHQLLQEANFPQLISPLFVSIFISISVPCE